MSPSSSANLAILKEAFAHLNARNIPGCLNLMRPDFIINIAEMPYQKTGHSAWKRHTEILFSAIPDVKVHMEDAIAADDKVAVRMRIRGTHRGEFLGQRGTGKAIDYLSHEIYRFENGKIAEEWICSDSVTLMTQIGALSQGRLALMWFSGYRFWFGMASGIAVFALIQRAL
ncbi:hypothetical protein K4F52_007307 [Lecanicillium sp. MT-2017a]|nr:hypothetical protein K4F52_007307 [Lecanicillium sp. MT-2017a]